MAKPWERRKVEDYLSPCELWAIVNPHGMFWSSTTYHTEAAAMAYVSEFWDNNADQVSKFKAIPVTCLISDARIEVLSPKEAKS